MAVPQGDRGFSEGERRSHEGMNEFMQWQESPTNEPMPFENTYPSHEQPQFEKEYGQMRSMPSRQFQQPYQGFQGNGEEFSEERSSQESENEENSDDSMNMPNEMPSSFRPSPAPRFNQPPMRPSRMQPQPGI